MTDDYLQSLMLWFADHCIHNMKDRLMKVNTMAERKSLVMNCILEKMDDAKLIVDPWLIKKFQKETVFDLSNKYLKTISGHHSMSNNLKKEIKLKAKNMEKGVHKRTARRKRTTRRKNTRRR
jgi:hypothetical protein